MEKDTTEIVECKLIDVTFFLESDACMVQTHTNGFKAEVYE